jgi:hypothetical protein
LAAGTSRRLEQLQRAASAAAVAAALGMLAWRFANFDLVPFINDEPRLLKAASEQVATGRWAQASIPGTQGFTYGPSAIWFYGLVQLVFGRNPAASLAAMCALVTAAHLWLCAALARALKGGPILFATLLALLASSPYQFFWSRLAWDNQLVNALAAIAVALLATRAQVSLARCAALGLALGFALSAHLMVAPLVLLVGAVLAVEWRRTPVDLLQRAGVVAAAIALVNVPYALFLVRQPRPQVPPPESAASLLERLLEIPRVATSWKLGYFFDAGWPDFVATLPAPVQAALPAWTGASVALCAGMALAGLAALLAWGQAPARRLGALGLLAAVAYPVLYGVRGLALHPHYQFPVYWVVVAGVAGVLTAARSRPKLAVAAGAVVWVIALGQFALVQRWMNFIRAEGGTRGVHYATPLAAQRELIRRACAAPQRELMVLNQTVLFPHSLQYVAFAEPACAGKRVTICPPSCALPAGGRVFKLHYLRPKGGALGLR